MLTNYLNKSYGLNGRNDNNYRFPSEFVYAINDAFDSFHKKVPHTWTQNENEYVLKLDLPGYFKSEIEVEVEKDTIFVKAENKERGKVDVSFISDALYENTEKISTKLENGVLSVIIPRNDRLKRKKIPLLG